MRRSPTSRNVSRQAAAGARLDAQSGPAGFERPRPAARRSHHIASLLPAVRDPWLWLLIGVSVLVFLPTLFQGFSPWDDSITVFENPYFSPVTFAHVLHFWRQPYEGLYNPLAFTLFAALAAIGHTQSIDPASGSHVTPHVFHLANVCLHATNVALTYLLLRRLVRRDLPAALGALLFGLHPIQVESVAWIPELRGLAVGLFSLLAIWWYLSYASTEGNVKLARRPTYYALSFVAGTLALLCKPTAASLALLLFALDRWCLGRPIRQCLYASAPFIIPGLLMVVVTNSAQPVDPSVVTAPLQRPFIAGDALAFYVVKLLVPLNFAIVYGRTPLDVLQHWWGYITWLIPAGIALGIWLRRGSMRWLAGAAIISLAALLPNLGLIPFAFQFYSTVADRYAYLALLGPALALAYLLATYRNWPLYTGVSAVLLCLAGLSILQIGYWDNGVKLWAHAASVSGSDTAYYSLGLQYSGNGMPYAAIDSFSRATQVNPSYADAHVALGTALLNIGHISQAVVELHRAIRLQPHRREAHFKLGIALAEAGQKSQALAEFREAIRLTPDRAERQRQERALRTLQRNLDSSH